MDLQLNSDLNINSMIAGTEYSGGAGQPTAGYSISTSCPDWTVEESEAK